MKTLLRILLLTLPAVLLSGCWWPENFTATVEINDDRTYHFHYDGILAFAPAVAAVTEEGGLDRQTERALKEAERELLEEEGFKSVNYQGKGRYKVVYEQSGVVDRPIHLFSDELKLVTLRPHGEGIIVEGMVLDAQEQKQIREIGLGFDGRVRIVSGLSVVNHNANSTPALGVGAYEWHLTFANMNPPQLTTSGEPAPKPIAPALTGGNRLWMLVAVAVSILVGILIVRSTRKKANKSMESNG